MPAVSLGSGCTGGFAGVRKMGSSSGASCAYGGGRDVEGDAGPADTHCHDNYTAPKPLSS